MIAQVIVDVMSNSVDKVFDYSFTDTNIQIGSRVLVPFAGRNVEGYVINIKDTSDYTKQIKNIIRPLDPQPLIKPELVDLVHKLKDKFYLRMVDAIKLVVPSSLRNNKTKQRNITYLGLDEQKLQSVNIKPSAVKQRQIIQYLVEKGKEAKPNLNQLFGSAAVNKLIELGVLTPFEQRQYRGATTSFSITNKPIVLTKYQRQALDTISAQKEGTFLLFGVTGSGKTQVYLNLIDKALKQGKTAIMLVPEISLTPQVVSQFIARFQDNVAVLHSRLTDGERYDQWQRIYNKEAKIVVGARSAIFAPCENVGVIIIDEEHDNSYVSDSNPRYITSDVAQLRAQYNHCPLVLGSATPSIESYYKAQTGQYTLLELPVRVNNKKMPTIEIVDMTKEFRNGNTSGFSETLLNYLQQVIDNKQQAMLFINRRGYSSFVMCKSCGYIPKCDDCDSHLVYHKEDKQLKCHYCGKRFKPLTICPQCGAQTVKYGNTGTEKVKEELEKYFPGVKILRMDNDTTRQKDAHAKILNEFKNTKPCVLVGTQMIAKGHDFSDVTFVGILDADLSLYFCDFRATEKTFALITQVAGRAGRDELEGHIVLQTYFPRHYVYNFAANYDYKNFYLKEINLRQTTSFPPFCKMMRLLVSDSDDDTAKQTTASIYSDLKQKLVEYGQDFYFLRAMRSPLSRIKSKFRYQLVLRFSTAKQDQIIKDINSIVDKYNKKVSIFVETDPLSLS